MAEAGQIYRGYTNSDHGIDREIEFKEARAAPPRILQRDAMYDGLKSLMNPERLGKQRYRRPIPPKTAHRQKFVSAFLTVCCD